MRRLRSASPAYGYRFDYKGRWVVISGDTRKWPLLAVRSTEFRFGQD